MSRKRLSASRDEHRKPRRRRWERLNSKDEGKTSNIEHPTLNSNKSRAGIECQKRTARLGLAPPPLRSLRFFAAGYFVWFVSFVVKNPWLEKLQSLCFPVRQAGGVSRKAAAVSTGIQTASPFRHTASGFSSESNAERQGSSLFGANRRQAAGFRQCPAAREVSRWLTVFCCRLRSMTCVSPVALPAKNYRPAKKNQSCQEKRAKINQGLTNTGTGRNQRPKRIVFADAERACQKNWSCHNNNLKPFVRNQTGLGLVIMFFRGSIPQARIEAVIP